MNVFKNIGFLFNKNNHEYILSEVIKTNNINYIRELIENANQDIIDYEILSIAVEKGYEINSSTPIPKKPIQNLHELIQNCNNSKYLKFVV